MTKKQKHEETGDSDDLQALFDAIASGGAKPGLEIVSSRPPDDDGSGDDASLQALFDEVAASFEAPAEASSSPQHGHAPADPEAGAAPVAAEEAVFNRIGVMTRQVHDTLSALSGDDSLKDAVDAIPDARERLNYIAVMTEQAASRVLNATDIAKPLQDKVLLDARNLEGRWEKLFDNQLSIEEFKALAGETRGFLGQVQNSSHATNAQLMEIMMAQDFQDLTGQVIKKVLDLAQTLETELVKLLLDVTPPDKRVAKREGLLNGPVINARDRQDVVTSQEQVDDLLDSLGF